MTAAEASEIDRLEFEAERAALRQRAAEIIGAHQARIRALAEVLAGLDNSSAATAAEPKRPNTFNRSQRGVRGKGYTHAGLTLTISEWADRLGIPANRLAYRITKGWPLSEALTSTNRRGKPRHRGVVNDFASSNGTGVGSIARETVNIDFYKDRTVQ
jgi:hypothetical protein